MDTFNPNQMPPIPNNMVQPEKKSAGPLVAVIIILVLILVGGLYFLKQRAAEPVYTPPQVQNTTPTDPVADNLKQQGSSDDLESIEADLNATDIDAIDQGASVIEANL